MLEKAAAE
jgi:transcription termination factor Rho